jgi:hypothetical protein
MAFLVLLLCEIAEPRFGLLGQWARGWQAIRVRLAARWRALAAPRIGRTRRTSAAGMADPGNPSRGRHAKTGPEQVPLPPDFPPAPDPPPAESHAAEDMDYLRESKSQARRKMG